MFNYGSFSSPNNISKKPFEPKERLVDKSSSVAPSIVGTIEQWYEMGRTLGKGEFAKVKLARCRETGEKVQLGQSAFDVEVCCSWQ